MLLVHCSLLNELVGLVAELSEYLFCKYSQSEYKYKKYLKLVIEYIEYKYKLSTKYYNSANWSSDASNFINAQTYSCKEYNCCKWAKDDEIFVKILSVVNP
jgi:hypothetical protein